MPLDINHPRFVLSFLFLSFLFRRSDEKVTGIKLARELYAQVFFSFLPRKVFFDRNKFPFSFPNQKFRADTGIDIDAATCTLIRWNEERNFVENSRGGGRGGGIGRVSKSFQVSGKLGATIDQGGTIEKLYGKKKQAGSWKNGVAWKSVEGKSSKRSKTGRGKRRGGGGALPDETGGFSLLLHPPGSHFLSSWANVTN